MAQAQLLLSLQACDREERPPHAVAPESLKAMPNAVAVHIQKLKDTLASAGVRAALKYMNEHTTHRFSAIYLFDPDSTLRNLYFYDRENPAIERVEDIPVEASYCVFVRQAKAPFTLTDSWHDSRVASHPKKQEFRSYTGIPLLDEYGNMFGSMCHFDYEPAAVDHVALELMEAIGPLIRKASPAA